MSIMEDVQELDIGDVVELYDVDLIEAGYGEILYFTPSSGNGEPIVFGNTPYLPLGVEMTGFSKSSQDLPPEPTFTMSNVDKGGNSLLATYNNLIGAKITRRRTLAKYLDFLEDGVTPNPSKSWESQFMPEVWYVEQKEEGNPILVKWRMKSSMDLEGKMIPGRRVLKSYCQRNYRFWDASIGAFRYHLENGCPYNGANNFDRFGNPCAPADDECDKSHGGCGLRFPEGLMTWAFPGADRLPD